MDRQQLSAVSVKELGEVFMAALQQAGPELLEADLEGIERHLQRVMRPVMERVVEMVMATIAATRATVQPVCTGCGDPGRLVDLRRQRRLQGLLGDYTLHRLYLVCDTCHQGMASLDERLELGRASLSSGLSRVASRLGLEDAFGEGVDVLAEAVGVDVAKEGMRRITEGIGAVAEGEQQPLMAAARRDEIPPLEAAAGHPTVLAVEVDGIMVHTDAAWHEAKVGTVAPLGPESEPDPDTERDRLAWVKASYCVGIEEVEDFWFRTYWEACRRGLTRGLETVVVLGGSGDALDASRGPSGRHPLSAPASGTPSGRPSPNAGALRSFPVLRPLVHLPMVHQHGQPDLTIVSRTRMSGHP